MQTSAKRNYWPETFGIILCLLIGLSGAIATKSSDYAWYASLNKPSFNPPDWIFGPVWTVLYILLGIVFGQVWKIRREYPALLAVFIVQLIFNALWSVIFFQYHEIAWALMDIIALWLSVSLLMMLLLKPAKTAGLLLIPYWCWVSFAVVLNATLLALAMAY